MLWVLYDRLKCVVGGFIRFGKGMEGIVYEDVWVFGKFGFWRLVDKGKGGEKNFMSMVFGCCFV